MNTHEIGHLASIVAFGILTYSILSSRRSIFRNLKKGRWVFRTTLILGSSFMLINALLLLESLGADSARLVSPHIGDTINFSGLTVLAGLGVTLLRSRIVTERALVPKRVFAVGAHGDDLEIACGATLAKMRDAGHIVYGLVLTRGEQGGEAAVRADEAQQGSRFMGLDVVEVLDFDDTRLKAQSNELCQTIEAIITRFRPDIILTHSANDQHQDHTAVYEATLRAARNHSTILCYESPSVTRAFSPTVFVDVANYIDVKIESIRQHRDQRSKSYVQDERVRGVASYRGGQAKIRYAEAFESVRVLSAAFGDI